MKSPFKTPPKKGQTHPSTIAGGFKDVFEIVTVKYWAILIQIWDLSVCFFFKLMLRFTHVARYRYWSKGNGPFLMLFLGGINFGMLLPPKMAQDFC